MDFYTHFSDKETRETVLPPLNKWRIVEADTHRDAAIVSCKMLLPWKGMKWCHVHGERDLKHDNGRPMVVHTFKLEIK